MGNLNIFGKNNCIVINKYIYLCSANNNINIQHIIVNGKINKLLFDSINKFYNEHYYFFENDISISINLLIIVE